MKKLILIAILIVCLFLLSSCEMVSGNIEENIISPENKFPPVLGKWVIAEELEEKQIALKNDVNSNIGKEALFHKDAVVIGEHFTTKPSFKIKYVNARDYLLYKYKTFPGSIGVEQEEIEVITLLNDDKFFYELLRIDKDTMIINIEDKFYSMEKSVEEVSLEEIKRYINVERTKLRTLGEVEEESLVTGILLGVKTPFYDESNQRNSWKYKTIWINSENRKIASIYELDDLLLPRKNGFWIIDVKKDKAGNSIDGEITATPQFRLPEESPLDGGLNLIMEQSLSSQDRYSSSVISNILFVGNDYISVENIDLNRDSRRSLQIYAIDNIEERKPMTLSNLIGESGKEIFNEGARTVIPADSSVFPNETNIGLKRRNGYWIFYGRVNYKENEEELYKDFNIKAIPPKEMVSYDEIIIPWDAIKLAIPDAVDIFSSPNDEFIIVITSSHMIIYSIVDGAIINNPVAKVKIPYGSSVIMSEWASGRFVSLWENVVIKNGGVELEY
ncbi:MAG: hypothetical protein GX231_05115 [Tissierellia bacterium]|nr:hypothetical protein [Tissierellia bacterium]